MYFNSLLSTLNSREALQDKVTGLSDVPIASGYSRTEVGGNWTPPADIYSMKSPVSHDLSSFQMGDPLLILELQRVVVTIDRTVNNDEEPDSPYVW